MDAAPNTTGYPQWLGLLTELIGITGNADELERVIRKSAAMGPTPEASAAAFVASLEVMARHRIEARTSRRPRRAS